MGSMETVISKADPLIENPPSLFFQTSVITDPRAVVLPCYHTFQITLCNEGTLHVASVPLS